MVLPPEHSIESARSAETTLTGPHELHRLADQVTREMQDVARRRGWAATTPTEPPATAAPYALFCGARSEDLARRRIAGHSAPDRTNRTP